MQPPVKSGIDSKHATAILVYSAAGISDAVMAFPLLQRLRELEPTSHITVLCPAPLRDLWQRNAYLNDVLTAPGSHALRERRFALAVILPNSYRAAWECWRARIPRRVGFAGHRRRWLLTDIVQESRGEQAVPRPVTVAGVTINTQHFASPRHQAHRYLDFISHLGGNRDLASPKLRLEAGQLPALTKFLSEGARSFIGIHPGGCPAKRWPAEQFADTARRIADEVPCRFIIFGGPGETAIADEVERHLRAGGADDRAIVNVAGQTTLMELCELLSCCKLVLANDSGPMHLAAALGVAVVGVYGSTLPELTGPLGPQGAVVRGQAECAPCFLRECPIDSRCLRSVTGEEVAATALKLLSKSGTAR